MPLLVQLLLAEFIVDLLKLASLNTPDVFSNSFSMLGALVLGDFAVQAHWLVPEVLAYMAFVAIANFAQPSYELGYAFKLLRLMLLLFVGALDWVGLALGCIGIIAAACGDKADRGEGVSLSALSARQKGAACAAGSKAHQPRQHLRTTKKAPCKSRMPFSCWFMRTDVRHEKVVRDFRLENALSHHGVSDLLEASDVSTGDQVVAQAIALGSLNRSIVDVLHDGLPS